MKNTNSFTKFLIAIVIISFFQSCQNPTDKNTTEIPNNKRQGKTSFRDCINNGKQKIELIITKKEFSAEKHNISYQDTIKEWTALIDGKKPIGTDGSAAASSEIDSFFVKWPDTTIMVPKNIYSDCYNPNLRTIYWMPSEDGSEILINMTGSDGAGTYHVGWIIRKKGSCNRYLYLYEYQFND